MKIGVRVHDFGKSNAETLAKDIKTDEDDLTEMRAKMDSAKIAADNTKKEYDEANNRLATMNHSMEDVFVTLRKRLINEHEEFCPLCGQKLEKIHMEEEFRHILTPIEKEQQEKEAAHKAAEKKYNKAKRSCDTFAGSLTTKKKLYETIVDDIKEDEVAIRKDAQKVNVVILETFVPDDMLTAINTSVDAKTTEEEALKQTTRLVRELGIKDSARIDTIYRMHLKYARWRQKGLTRAQNMQRMQAIHNELEHLLTPEEFEQFMNHPSETPRRPHGTQLIAPATSVQPTDSL